MPPLEFVKPIQPNRYNGNLQFVRQQTNAGFESAHVHLTTWRAYTFREDKHTIATFNTRRRVFEAATKYTLPRQWKHLKERCDQHVLGQ
jgi:hypothetical protein